MKKKLFHVEKEITPQITATTAHASNKTKINATVALLIKYNYR